MDRMQADAQNEDQLATDAERAQRPAHDRFKRGSGTYRCPECGKQTRDTGHGEASVGLCKACYQAAEQANADSDNG